MGTPESTKPPATTGRHDLGRATWPDVASGAAVVPLVPVGSCEQHGPHLPLDTDTRIARALAERVAASTDGVLVAPAVAFGASGEHQGFPGTLSVGTDVLRSVLVELGRSAFPDPSDPAGAPYRALVFVNGHGGNAAPLTDAVRVLVGEGRPVSAWSPRVPGADAHAGRTETSLLLALFPDLVGAERPVGATQPIEDLLPRLRRGGVVAVSPGGVLGDARGADATQGRELVEDLVADLRDTVAGIRGDS